MKQNIFPLVFMARNKLAGRSSYLGTPPWTPPSMKTPQEPPSIKINEIFANLSADIWGIAHSSPRSRKREGCPHFQNQNLIT